MEVDESNIQQENDFLASPPPSYSENYVSSSYDSGAPSNVARPPPIIYQPSEDTPSTQPSSTISDVSSMTSSSSSLQDLKDSITAKADEFQAKINELNHASAADRQRRDALNSEIMVMKQNLEKTEKRVSSSQRVLANMTDKNKALERERVASEGTLRSLIAEIRQQVNATIGQVTELSAKVVELSQRINETSSRLGGGGQSPDDLMQMLEPYERQLGMYDVRIAELDSRFQVLESTNYSGSLVWKITDYQRKRNEAVQGRTLSLYSEPFYTSRYGYKMCARVYLNGDGMGKGTHMSLFFVVMKGDYDALLAWPFRQKVTLMLLDQGVDRRHLSDTFRPDPTSSSFKRPTSDMNIASGCPLFVSHSVITGSNAYVKDNTIFLRIIVDVSDLDNP